MNRNMNENFCYGNRNWIDPNSNKTIRKTKTLNKLCNKDFQALDIREHRTVIVNTGNKMWAPLLFQIAAYRESSDCSIERKNPFRAQQSPGQKRWSWESGEAETARLNSNTERKEVHRGRTPEISRVPSDLQLSTDRYIWEKTQSEAWERTNQNKQKEQTLTLVQHQTKVSVPTRKKLWQGTGQSTQRVWPQ